MYNRVRIRARMVVREEGDLEGRGEVVLAAIEIKDHKRVGGRSRRREEGGRRRRRRVETQQRYRVTLEEDRSVVFPVNCWLLCTEV